MKYWNGYGVDENGTIYNKDGTVKSLKTNKKGYLFSNFYYEGKLHCHLAHTLVAEAFFGEKPEGYEVDHMDNVRDNNKVSNLQYLTKSENNQKSYDSGNRESVFGDTNPNSKVRKNVQRLDREIVGQPSQRALEIEGP